MKTRIVVIVLIAAAILLVRGATKNDGQPSDGNQRMAVRASKVEIGFRKIRYSEGERFIEFGFDYTGEGQVIIYIPSAERWGREMPDWAKGRRDEILREVKHACAKMKPIYEEY